MKNKKEKEKMTRSFSVKTAKKSAIFLLGVLVVLLAVSFLPFGSDSSNEKAAVAEKTKLTLQLQELNSLPSSIDEKIEPEVKEQVREALYLAAAAKTSKEREEKGKVVVVVEAKGDIDSEIRAADGEISSKASTVSKDAELVAVEVDAAEVAVLAGNDDVVKVYPVVTYYTMLDESVPMVKADAFWNAGFKGDDVRVAVLDSGVDKSHPMLKGKVVAERDFSKSGNAEDKLGHGTHVAGIAAGTTADGGKYSGVAPGALILNAKVINDDTGEGKNIYLIEAIGWALDPDGNPGTDDGAKIISMSLGARTNTDTLVENAIKAAVEKGAIVIVASGNCGPNCKSGSCSLKCDSFRGVTSPGSSAHVITVGAVDKAQVVAEFSGGGVVEGVGIKPDFVAPGVDIRSSVPSGGYEAKMGTSMATPHVSGAVALMLGRNPTLKQEDVRRILEKTSLDLGDIGKDTSYGFGLIDMAKALIYREGLVFDVKLEKQVVSGTAQKITVTVHDDVHVNSVKVALTKPDGTRTGEFAFTSSGGNAYAYEFTDTAKLGVYIVELTVNYGGAAGGSIGEGGSESETPTVSAYYTTSFKVTSLTGDFGNIEEIKLSMQQSLSRNITGSLVFGNTAPTDLAVSALLQLMSKGTVAQEMRLPSVIVAASSKATVVVSNALEVGPGNYTLRMLTDYGAGSIVNETNITVADDLAPQILKVDYSKTIKVNDAQSILVEVVEHQRVQAELQLSQVTETAQGTFIESIIANHTVKLLSEIGNRKTIAITIFNGSNLIGEKELDEGNGYVVTLQLCDTSGNCAGKLGSGKKDAEFSITACIGKSVLAVKTYDTTSVFEEAAAAAGNVCLSVINKSVSGTPPSSYLERFDAVIWTTGTDLVNVDGNDAAVIADYYGKKGRIAVEGSDIAFRHGSDDFMRSVLHSELKDDLGFTVTSAAEMGNLSINVTMPHPVVTGLPAQLKFNSTIDPFPDAVQPYNGSVELAEWSSVSAKGSALVVYEAEDGKAKSLFMPFSIEALASEDAKTLAAKALGWLLDDSAGISTDVAPAGIEHGFLVEGEIAADAIVRTGEQLGSAPKVKVLVDGSEAGVSVENSKQAGSSQPAYAFPFKAKLQPGAHTVTVIGNSDFAVKETSYANNVGDFAITVYQKQPDLLLSGLTYSYDEGRQAVVIGLNASNLGGTEAASALKAFLGGKESAAQDVSLAAGETKQLKFELKTPKGTYKLKAVIDPDNGIAEHSESNNELLETLYICSKEKVLVVDDNDAAFFSTPEPSSADEFLEVLRREGYCVEVWDEKQRGVPGSSELNNFKVVVWSAGDYFNGTISNEDAMAIGNFTGGLLIEGSDVGLDSSDNDFLQGIAAAAFASDMLLNESQPEQLVLKQHNITEGIGAISISKEKSPYPDAAEAVEGEVAAEWQSGKAAIIARALQTAEAVVTAAGVSVAAKDAAKDKKSPYKTAYYSFSVDGVTDNAARDKLVLNTVQWLLQRPNSKPQIGGVIASVEEGGFETAAVKISMKEGQTKTFQIIATDPDNDLLTYKWLLNGNVVSTTDKFTFSPKYNEAGTYTVTAIVSDGKAEAKAEFVIEVQDTMECDPLVGKQPCQLQQGVCKGSTETCNDAGKWLGCAAPAYAAHNAKYEETEKACDGTDNDCDGKIDEGFEDVDGDKIADCVDDDNDNDGVNDKDDDVIGDESHVSTDIKGVKFEVEDKGDKDRPKFKAAKFSAGEKMLAKLDVDFAKAKLDMRKVKIKQQAVNDEKGYTIFSAAGAAAEKTLYVDRVVSSSNAVCVKDAEISGLAEISAGCKGNAETFVKCKGKAPSAEELGKTKEPLCWLEAGRFVIAPLKHSGVVEACADADLDTYLPAGCDSGLDCNDNDKAINPAAKEVCNNADDDCDGKIDEDRVCNTAPKLQAIGNKAVGEGKALAFTITATDNENDKLAYSALNMPQGATFDTNTATFAWTPTFEQAGVYTVTFKASDGLLTAEQAIAITVADTNREPVIKGVSGNTKVREGEEATIVVTAEDSDSDSIQYSVANAGKAKFSQSASKNLFAWKTGYDDAGVYKVTVTASDGSLSASQEVTVEVANANRPPKILGPIGDKQAKENEQLSFALAAEDPDGDKLAWSAEYPPEAAGITIDTNGKFSWTPTFEQAGNYKVTLKASDGELSAQETITVTVANVNRPPVIKMILVEPGGLIMAEGETKTFTATVSDSDNEKVTTLWKLNGAQASTGQVFRFSPNHRESGEYVIELVLSDSESFTSQKLTLTVQDTMLCEPLKDKKPCPLQLGVCRLSTETCSNEGKFASCSGAVYKGYSEKYEETETSCDYLDNDCDGQTDEDPSCPAKFCSDGIKNQDEAGVDCGGKCASPAEEVCNGVDDDRDCQVDEGLKCTCQDSQTRGCGLGVCGGGTQACGSGAWSDCSTDSRKGEEKCDKLDNDCDGLVDEDRVCNTAPKFAKAVNQVVKENQHVAMQLAATDSEPDALTFTAKNLPKGAVLIGNVFIWTPTYYQAGEYDAEFTVSDGLLSDSQTVTIKVEKDNRPPKVKAIVEPHGSEMKTGESKLLKAEASDPDGDSLEYKWFRNGNEVAKGSSYTFSPKPAEEGVSGAQWFTVVASDGKAESKAEVVLNVIETAQCTPGAKRECPLQAGACHGSKDACGSDGKWLGCTAATYLGHNPKYETVETACDGLDNDCDGKADAAFDLDGDGIEDCADDDDDNDGVKDSEDEIKGDERHINTQLANVKLEVKPAESGGTGDSDSSKVKEVKFTAETNAQIKTVAEFKADFATTKLDMRKVSVKQQEAAENTGYTIFTVADAKLMKTIYVDKLSSSSNAVCVKDAEVSEISQVSAKCDETSEYLLVCADAKPSGAELSDAAKPLCWRVSSTALAVSPLKHSAVLETCADADQDTYLPTGCNNGNDCNDNDKGINPGATEKCNSVDDNCDGKVDEGIDCNQAPVISSVAPSGPVSIDEGQSVDFSVSASDPDGDAISYKWKLDSTEVSAAATYKYSTKYDSSGTHTVEVEVSDGKLTASAAVTVTIKDTMECLDGSEKLCPLQSGVCSAAKQSCASGKWQACSYGASYQAAETLCDDLDNNCDGQVDEGVKNACGKCGPAPQETCHDSIDNNCNGAVDEGCPPPPRAGGRGGGGSVGGGGASGAPAGQPKPACNSNGICDWGENYVNCQADCKCGNSQIDAGEECDGFELNGQTCASKSFTGGTLQCSTCRINTYNCYTCGDGSCENSKGETDSRCPSDCQPPKICSCPRNCGESDGCGGTCPYDGGEATCGYDECGKELSPCGSSDGSFQNVDHERVGNGGVVGDGTGTGASNGEASAPAPEPAPAYWEYYTPPAPEPVAAPAPEPSPAPAPSWEATPDSAYAPAPEPVAAPAPEPSPAPSWEATPDTAYDSGYDSGYDGGYGWWGYWWW